MTAFLVFSGIATGVDSCGFSLVTTGEVGDLEPPQTFPANKSTPPKMETAPAGFFLAGLAGSTISASDSLTLLPLPVDVVKSSSFCLVLGIVGGEVALSCFTGFGLAVNKSASSSE